MAFIYKLTNPLGQMYIGQTKDLERRMEHYRELDCTSQVLICRSLSTYGFDAHKLEILKICPIEELDYWEIRFINEHRSCVRDNREFGLNVLKESYADYLIYKAQKKASRSKKKLIQQYSLSGVFIKEWKTAASATKKLKLKKGTIVKALEGFQKTAGGFIWKYKD